MGNYDRFFSQVALARKPSPIRVLTAIQLASGPEMISLAGGMPNPTKFPFDSLNFGIEGKQIALSDAQVAQGLQYAPSKGVPAFVKQLNNIRQNYHGGKTAFEDDLDVAVAVGSQNGLEMLLQSLISPGDGILVDDPIYPGTKMILNPLGANMIPIETDSDGMDTDDLEIKIKNYKKKCNLKVIMTVANGGNPTGSTLSLERRHKLLHIAEKYDLIVIEDDPYYFLQFEKPDPSLFELDWASANPKKRVIRSDSFSKVLSAGIRIGWLTGPKEIIQKVELTMQASILHTPALIQVICSRLLTEWGDKGFDDHIISVREFYESQRNKMIKAAENHLDGIAEWYSPRAGLFLWIKLNGIEDTSALIEEKARNANVLLCPGSYFAVVDGLPSSYCRAAFSLASEEDMNEAFKRLAKLIRENQ